MVKYRLNVEILDPSHVALVALASLDCMMPGVQVTGGLGLLLHSTAFNCIQ